jgi:methylmalonyl-CoA/ethylmalonyl-CoA epimerase
VTLRAGSIARAVQVRGVHHVALAVEDLDEAVAVYRRLFDAEIELEGRMEEQGVDAVYLRVGDGRVELVSPLDADTPVGRFLAKRGPGMHHIAFEVDSIEDAIDELTERGAVVIDPEPRPGLGGKRVAFVHPDSLDGVLAEVLSV